MTMIAKLKDMPCHRRYTILLLPKIVNFFTKLSDQRERAIADQAVARIWLAAQPPWGMMIHASRHFQTSSAWELK